VFRARLRRAWAVPEAELVDQEAVDRRNAKGTWQDGVVCPLALYAGGTAAANKAPTASHVSESLLGMERMAPSYR